MTTEFQVIFTYESVEYTFIVAVKPAFEVPDDFEEIYDI